MTDVLSRYLRLFEDLTPATIGELSSLTTADVVFRDPFNDTRGQEAMQRVFEQMFRDVRDPRFRIIRVLSNDAFCFVNWQFTGRIRGLREPVDFTGMSEIRLASNGLVSRHIDYWDAASEIYQKLPLLGWVVKRLKTKLGAGA